MTAQDEVAHQVSQVMDDLSSALRMKKLKVTTIPVSRAYGELRVKHPVSGLSQLMAIGACNGAVLIYWIWGSPADHFEPGTPPRIYPKGSILDAETNGDLGSNEGSPETIREYEPVGLPLARMLEIADRVCWVIEPKTPHAS